VTRRWPPPIRLGNCGGEKAYLTPSFFSHLFLLPPFSHTFFPTFSPYQTRINRILRVVMESQHLGQVIGKTYCGSFATSLTYPLDFCAGSLLQSGQVCGILPAFPT
jgi:hypothetical protein